MAQYWLAVRGSVIVLTKETESGTQEATFEVLDCVEQGDGVQVYGLREVT